MNIEEIFKRSKVDYNKLINYGFKKEKDNYKYTKLFMNNNFKAIITINKEGIINGKIIDLQFNEEYTNINIDKFTGTFVNKVRNNYKDILLDIKNNCFKTNYFISEQANRITNYIINKYDDKPEFLWDKYPSFGVFRNKDNNKWYGIIMNIDISKLNKNKSGEIEIINVKLDENTIKSLINNKNYYEAYHMNKKNWLTITLDNSLPDKEIIENIDKSYINIK